MVIQKNLGRVDAERQEGGNARGGGPVGDEDEEEQKSDHSGGGGTSDETRDETIKRSDLLAGNTAAFL